MQFSISTNHMKYITLILIFAVFFYFLSHNVFTPDIIATSSFYASELPIYCVDTDQKVVALTFDSAWGTEDLDQILSILEKHNAPAAFFVTGEWALKYPEAITAINNAGHELANHGNSHKHMPQLSKEEMALEIKGCHDTVYN
ncbi:MAG: polysaccharide deacetylase family protein, partial [Lachnospiraceae bacterium]|nr:polysaccharide deacetylase family protein [Lachnospiraceae bacterium]